ncbi:MAG: hypothetical protein ACYDAA_16555 [Syntrophales bacterium]
MEKVLRRIGSAFLFAANAFGDARNAIHAYLFDLAFEDDHSTKHNSPLMFSPPSNHSHLTAQIISFPSLALRKITHDS